MSTGEFVVEDGSIPAAFKASTQGSGRKSRSTSPDSQANTDPGSVAASPSGSPVASESGDFDEVLWRIRGISAAASTCANPGTTPKVFPDDPPTDEFLESLPPAQEPMLVVETTINYADCTASPLETSSPGWQPSSVLAMTARCYEAALNIVALATSQAAVEASHQEVHGENMEPDRDAEQALATGGRVLAPDAALKAGVPLTVLRMSDDILDPMLGSPQLPSLGSVGHHQSGRGQCCRPCVFVGGHGCPHGSACLCCHLCTKADVTSSKAMTVAAITPNAGMGSAAAATGARSEVAGPVAGQCASSRQYVD